MTTTIGAGARTARTAILLATSMLAATRRSSSGHGFSRSSMAAAGFPDDKDP